MKQKLIALCAAVALLIVPLIVGLERQSHLYPPVEFRYRLLLFSVCTLFVCLLFLFVEISRKK